MKVRSSPTHKNIRNPEEISPEENKYKEKNRNFLGGSEKNPYKFPTRIYAKLEKRYDLKKRSPSPIDELENSLNRSGSNKKGNRLEKSWEKMNELTTMLENLPKRNRETRYHPRKYNYKEPV